MVTYYKQGDLCPRCKEGKLIQEIDDYETMEGQIIKVKLFICDFCKHEAEMIPIEEQE